MRFSLNQVSPFTDEFCFRSLRNPKISDALVIHNPTHAVCESPVLIRSTKTLQEHISLIGEKCISSAIIVAESIDFLRKCPSLECIHIIPALSVDKLDYSPIYDMPRICWLRCEIPHGDNGKSPLICGKINELECLSVDGWSANLDVSSASRLKTLYLGFGNPREKDLSIFQTRCGLQNLVVENSHITSLSGIENAYLLKRLELHYNKKLEDVSQLLAVKDTLLWLDINNCNKITDLSVLSELRNLELLRLTGTNGVPSLEFLKNMPKLKCLVVMVDVFDGDMSWCTNIPYVAIKNRKHFSHKDAVFSKDICFPYSITAYE